MCKNSGVNMANIFDNIQVPVYSAPVQAAEQNNPVSVPVKDALPATDVKGDTVELSTASAEKKGPVKKFKGFIANIKKVFASTGEYTKGTVKGVGYGAVGGSLVYTGSKLITGVKKFLNKNSQIKALPAKTLAILTAVGVLAVNLWKASLNATEKRSEIDLRYTGLEK